MDHYCHEISFEKGVHSQVRFGMLSTIYPLLGDAWHISAYQRPAGRPPV